MKPILQDCASSQRFCIMTYKCNEGECTYSSFTEHSLDIHRSVAHNGADSLTIDDSTLEKINKPKISNRRENRPKMDHVTACNAEHFLASSLLHNVNRQVFTIPGNNAGSASLSTKTSKAETSAPTEQFNVPTAVEVTEMIIGESFSGVDEAIDNKKS